MQASRFRSAALAVACPVLLITISVLAVWGITLSGQVDRLEKAKDMANSELASAKAKVKQSVTDLAALKKAASAAELECGKRTAELEQKLLAAERRAETSKLAFNKFATRIAKHTKAKPDELNQIAYEITSRSLELQLMRTCGEADRKKIEQLMGELEEARDVDLRNRIIIRTRDKIIANLKSKLTEITALISDLKGRSCGASQPYVAPETCTIGSHDRVKDSNFVSPWGAPFSTFSVDVDTASYAMVRRQLMARGYVDPDSVRVEEMINYFDYGYEPPKGKQPVAVSVEAADCPWNPEHRLVRIGLKAREIKGQRADANLVFLVDVSGSMESPDKLGLVQDALIGLISRLRANDRIAIVTYAGASGLVLDSTPCTDKIRIKKAIRTMTAGGSTNGGEGIQLAYKVAAANYIKGGVNRIILCTDGDFNVGISGRNELERLIEAKAKSGVYLTILGFGLGNFRDGAMEALSNIGNGNYAYIDDLKEAERVLGEKVTSTLVTVAKDVKVQVNFNRHMLSAYRLVGYENRRMAK